LAGDAYIIVAPQRDSQSRICHDEKVVWKSLAEDWMSLSTHLAELSEKHKLLERRIQEYRRLKRENLKLKDRINELKS
jgi:hypothetical protein